MKQKAQPKAARCQEELVIRPRVGAPLSRTQVDFNRLMKSLETTRTRHAREQARLDEVLGIAIRELMPLIEEINRVNRDLVFSGRHAWQTLKLSAKRRLWFGDLLSDKARELLADPVGLSAEEIERLENVIEELGPGVDEQRMAENDHEEFNFVRGMMEQAARDAGLELDLSDLDPNGDPVEFDRIANERLRAAFGSSNSAAASPAKAQRKPTKVQAEKERKRLELEGVRTRDLKSLFKQLAKAFHPDLEPDPLLKEHKEAWMKRLNTAYAVDDLREMLQLEMEWLGEEATNLATAGDEKLKVYCTVLKEQIAGLKRQIHLLPNEPQYGPLQRFRDPYYGTVANPPSIKHELHAELRHHRDMLEILSANDAASRRMIYDWADNHARRSAAPF